MTMNPFTPETTVPFDAILAARAASGIDLSDLAPVARPTSETVVPVTGTRSRAVFRIMAAVLALVVAVVGFSVATPIVVAAVAGAAGAVAGVAVLAVILTGVGVATVFGFIATNR